MKEVMARDDILDNLTQLLINGASKALTAQETHDKFSNFMLRIVYNRELKEGIYDSFVYSPVRSFFTFGQSQ